MPNVTFTDALRRYFPTLADGPHGAANLLELLEQLDGDYPGIRNYLLDDQRRVRPHVAIGIDGTFCRVRSAEEIALGDVKELRIVQALSGG